MVSEKKGMQFDGSVAQLLIAWKGGRESASERTPGIVTIYSSDGQYLGHERGDAIKKGGPARTRTEPPIVYEPMLKGIYCSPTGNITTPST